MLEIGLLEIKSALGEPVLISDIMDHVGYVKSIRDSGVKVRRVSRVSTGIVLCIEDKGWSTLRSWTTRWAKGEYVISTGNLSVSS
jgi:hypothetical protein